MKKKNLIYLILICVLIIQCQPLKEPIAKETCNENMMFKKVFFDNIDNVEFYIQGKGKRNDFDNGLTFLSNYVHVSFDDMANFSTSYTSLKSFNKDKDGWLKWYEENKCKNIQFK
jgi:hypothetical protein